MDSDDYFDDTLDDAFLDEIDVLEASVASKPTSQHTQPQPGPSRLPPPPQPAKPTRPPLSRQDTEVIEIESDDYEMSFNVDASELERLDNFIDDSYQGKVAPMPARPISRAPSKNAVQTTLDGSVLASNSDKRPPASNGGTGSTAPRSRIGLNQRNAFGVSHESRKVKQWDHTQFAKSGWKKTRPAKDQGKGKGRAEEGWDEWDEGPEEDEEEIEFEQFPAPFIPLGPPPPMQLQPDLLEARHWIYPLNRSRRDYQYNIVQHCLFENTLVALPTGLGKTFIAGVVMLNYYRWFPDGKIFFVAPTKPLVNQQAEACHQVCGIPGSHAAELTGSVTRTLRSRLYDEKRVFYMTPQTLVNDLASGTCDPMKLVLLVVDEAHKGTGDYAYAQCVRFLMAKNPHFRLLALTATPGSTPDAVQAIIDALHISRIEIRNERSMDLLPYMHKKHKEQHIIKMTGGIAKIRDLLAKVMEPSKQSIMRVQLIKGHIDVTTLHPFRVQAAMRDINNRRDAASLRWAFAVLSKLASLARAMGYLVEASAEMCYGCLQELANGSDKDGKKASAKGTQNKLRSDPDFQALIKEIEEQRNRGFELHPKMDKLRSILVDYFAKRIDQGEDGEGESKAMVFVTFRECVEEVVDMLNRESPLIRATKFIGQGTDKKGKKGYGQKKQLEVVERFKGGEWNVLVCTSIAEEGLDIGEIDVIVCYDAQKTPIRMLQRIGRTGRKRDGYVHVLLAEGREEQNWEKAQEQYDIVQDAIVRSEQLELFADVERLLPDHIKPEPLEQIMECEEYERPDARKAAEAERKAVQEGKGKKRKRNDDVGRNVPAGAATGFVSVADLIVKGSKAKKRKKEVVFNPDAGQDDDTDMEIESGIHGPRRMASEPASKAKKKKPGLTRSKTEGGAKKKPGTKKKSKEATPPSPTSSQFSRRGVDDDADLEIEQGLSGFIPASRLTRKAARKSPSPGSRAPSSSPEIPLATASKTATESVISLASSRPVSPGLPPSSPLPPLQDDSIIDIDPSGPSRSPSPRPTRSNTNAQRTYSPSRRPPSSSASPPPMEPPLDDDERQDLSWILSGSEDELFNDPPAEQSTSSNTLVSSGPDKFVPKLASAGSSPRSAHSPPPAPQPRARANHDMLPPALPSRFSVASPGEELEMPSPSQPVRAFGKRRARSFNVESSPIAAPPPSQRRLQRERSSSPTAAPAPKAKHKKRKIRVQDTAALGRMNPWLDVEATHSGDEVSEGSSVDDGLLESEGDIRFLEDLPATQADPDYDQTQVYRDSLLTQMPGRAGPAFARGPMRRVPFGAARRAGRRPVMSSSPPRDGDEEPDEYELGSFVVDDEISYAADSSEL